jgi:hypothetical protein
MIWTGLVWLRIGTSGGLLGTQQCTFGFSKLVRNPGEIERLAVSEELISMELVIGWLVS